MVKIFLFWKYFVGFKQNSIIMVDFFFDEFKKDFERRFDIDYEDWETIFDIVRRQNETVGISETADILRVSVETLRNWDKQGILQAIRTSGGHRKYLMKDIVQFQNSRTPKQKFLIEHGEKWIIRPYDYYPAKVSELIRSNEWDMRMCNDFERGLFSWFDSLEKCADVSAELRHRFIEKDISEDAIKRRIMKTFEEV